MWEEAGVKKLQEQGAWARWGSPPAGSAVSQGSLKDVSSNGAVDEFVRRGYWKTIN
jgi:hypothetical protein